MFGLRKSGKTSVIYAIKRRAKSFNCTPVFIDCQSPIVHARNYEGLLSHMVNEVRSSIGQSRRLADFAGTDVEISKTFRDHLKSALGQAKSRILIIFDEIENISPKTAASEHWREGRQGLLFWQNIRSFIQKDADGRLAVCLVGTNPSLLETSKIDGVANPMYLFSQKKFIPAFDFDETAEMVGRLGFFMGLEFEKTQIAKLQKEYGGHPFFIRQVCSNLHRIVGEGRPVEVSDRQIDLAIGKFGGQLEEYLRDILLSFRENYEVEFELLKSAALGDDDEISEYSRVAPELIDHLVGYGLVERRGDTVEVRFDAVKSALKRMFATLDTEGMWTECMKRRNRIEIDIRRELFVLSKSMDLAGWSEFLELSLSKRRYSNLNSIEPKQLFSRTDSELYWTDLMAIVKSDLAFGYLDERKPQILAAMDAVNCFGRNDAHAKEFKAEEFDEISQAFSILEDEFQQPV